MKNSFKTIILFIILGIILTSCQGDKTIEKSKRFGDGTYYDPSLRIIEENQKDGNFYSGERGEIDVVEKHSKYTKFDKNKTKLQSADAVEYVEGKMYIADSVSHEIAVFDLEGNRLKTIGKEGSGVAEFSSPVDIFYHAGHAEYYVLDAGNHRVQVFNLDDEFVREISLEAMELNKTESFQSVSVDNDKNIYIAPLVSPLNKQRLCRINEKGELFWYPRVVSGATIMADGKIYYFDNLEVFVSNDPSSSVTVKETSGKSDVYEVTEDNIEFVFGFPHNYAPSGIIIDGDKVYAFSSFYSRLDLFENRGGTLKYKHSITKQIISPNANSSFSYNIASSGSSIILAEKEDANIYLFNLHQSCTKTRLGVAYMKCEGDTCFMGGQYSPHNVIYYRVKIECLNPDGSISIEYKIERELMGCC